MRVVSRPDPKTSDMVREIAWVSRHDHMITRQLIKLYRLKQARDLYNLDSSWRNTSFTLI